MQVYFVPHVETVENGILGAARLGAQWLTQHQDEGTPFILVSRRDHASNNDVIQELTAKGEVPWCIPKNFPPNDWAGGPVLAPWADPKVIERIAYRPERITSLCVLKSHKHENQEWLEAHQAIDVTKPQRLRRPPTISDRVIRVAMEEITGTINLPTGLSHPSDRRFALGRLDYLKRWKHDLIAEEITPWALANGWGVAQARQLKDVIDRLNAGRTFMNIRDARIKDRGKLRRRWEQQAKGREPK